MTIPPSGNGLPGMVRFWATETPAKAALIDPDRLVTYAQLDATSNRIANTLIASGVPNGSHIGYLGKNSAALFEIWTGVNKAACALAPLNWRGAAAELVAQIEDAASPLVFTGREFLPLAALVRDTATIPVQIVVDDEVAAWCSSAEAIEPRVALEGGATALLAYTSGTTGSPKGVQISNDALASWFDAAATEPCVRWNHDDVGLMVMPNFHLAGTLVSLPALNHGASLAILPAFEPQSFVDAVAAQHVTVTCLVPTAIQMLLDHVGEQPSDLSSLRRILYAGSPISQQTLRQAMEIFDCDFVQFYGTTETYIITLLRPQQHRIDNPDTLKSCGRPMKGVELRIVDSDGVDVGDNVPGEVLVRSPWMFTGYWNKPDASGVALIDGWYHTGDAAVRDSHGNYFLVDRLKDMIVSGGENIYSAEVERAVGSHSSVQSVAVVGAPDPQWGERVVAFVVARADSTVVPSELIAHCRKLIAGYKVPKAIHVRNALPQTASGKVQKAALRQELRARSEPS